MNTHGSSMGSCGMKRFTFRRILFLIHRQNRPLQNTRDDEPGVGVDADGTVVSPAESGPCVPRLRLWADQTMHWSQTARFRTAPWRRRALGASMFANYRNCLWSCNWFPLRYAERNKIAAEKYGLPQGVSNGWQDNCGPSQMPPELLEAVLRRFTKNVESSRQRLRYLIS